MSGDFDFEPIRGLPELPPEGERILWQGAPEWRGLAWHAFHVREVAFYFAVLVAAQPALALMRGTDPSAALAASAFVALAGLFACAALALLAWLSARSTVYTVTNRRVVLRIGVALPMTINLPFAAVAGAELRLRGGGAGDLPLQLNAGAAVAYVILWPHARPWRLARPQPMLREVPDAAKVAETLARALAAHAGQSVAVVAQPARGGQGGQSLPHGVAAAH